MHRGLFLFNSLIRIAMNTSAGPEPCADLGNQRRICMYILVYLQRNQLHLLIWFIDGPYLRLQNCRRLFQAFMPPAALLVRVVG